MTHDADPDTTDDLDQSTWLAITNDHPTSDDSRLLALTTAKLTDAEPVRAPENPPGTAVFVMLTQHFPGADRELLTAITDAWFDHSGLFPAMATGDLNDQTVTFCKAVTVKDFHQGIRITWEGVQRALAEVALGDVVPVDGFAVDVSREQDWWPQAEGEGEGAWSASAS